MASNLFDDVADEGGSDEEEEEGVRGAAVPTAAGSDSSEDEGSEENDYDRTDGFLVDEEDEDEDEDEVGEQRKKKKKKRKRERDIALDDEDYELLAEAGIHRAKPQERRRIRKKVETDAAPYTTAAQLQAQLFGGEEEGLEDELDEPAADRRDRDAGLLDEDERMDDDEDDDFIDDDLGDGHRTGRRRRLSGVPEGVSSRALEEAQGIFGDVNELLRTYEASKANRAQRLGEAVDDEEPDEDVSDDEVAEQLRMERESQRLAKKATDILNPELLKRHHLLPQDQVIRDADLPEREQLALQSLGGAAEEDEPLDADACAAWVYERMFQTYTVPPPPSRPHEEEELVARPEAEIVADGILEVEGPPPDGRSHWRSEDRERGRKGELVGGMSDLKSRRGLMRRRTHGEVEKWRSDPMAQQRLKESIKQVVVHLWQKHEEVPFVAMYRKEVCGELLALRREDMPMTTTSKEEDDRRRKDLPEFRDGTVQAQHRRIRRWDVMWCVRQLSLRWRQLQRQRRQQQRQIEAKMQQAVSDAERQMLEACLDGLKQANTMESLADVGRKFQLAQQVGAAEAAADALNSLSLANGGAASARKSRRPHRTTVYSICHRAGLGAFVAQLGLTPEQLAENLEADYRRHEPQDPAGVPLELAGSYVTDVAGMTGPMEVLQAAMHMAVRDLAATPGVCKLVREVFQAHATVTTDATPAGQEVLNPFHPYGQVRRLQQKPVPLFIDNDQFLRIHLAEKEGLLTASLQVPASIYESRIIGRLREAYLSHNTDDVSQEWNQLRENVLSDAVKKHIIPALERELRVRLVADGREALLRQMSDKLWKYATQAPLKVESGEEEGEMLEPRIMAVCWGPGDPATTFVMLDSSGNMVDFLPCAHLSGMLKRPVGRRVEDYNLLTDTRKSKDAQRLLQFIKTHQPHVVVVGAGSPDCRQLMADVVAVRDHILVHEPQVLASIETGNVDVRFADELLAAMWQKSVAAEEELPDASATVRRAVALGRTMLDPLAIVASLCGPSREVLSLPLHPLQHAAPEEERMAALERVVITATCQIGVDINAVSRVPWLASPLQFVAGLGPRKAGALMKAIQRQQQVVDSRQFVWQELGVIGKLVFKNCAAFLKILGPETYDDLDGTRVHPLNYELAQEVARAACEGGRRPEKNPVQAALDSRNRWNVERVDLVALDQRIQQQRREQAAEEEEEEDMDGAPSAAGGAGSSRGVLPTLIDIQLELLMPFGELREELGQPKEEELFWMLTGQDPGSLRQGRQVEVTVRWVGQDEARCTIQELPGVDAVLRVSDISANNPNLSDARDVLSKDDVLPARIQDVDFSEFRISVTTRSSDLNNARQWELEYIHKDDPWYHVPSEEEERRAMLEEKRKTKAKGLPQRPIQHPYYKNASIADAVNELDADENGECMFTPGKDNNTLRLSLKLYSSEALGSVFQHMHIYEGPKGGMGTQASLRLGTPLTIGWHALNLKAEEKYEDLDEIVARFVDPYFERVREVTRHRKFRDGEWATLKPELQEEKRRLGGNMAAYCLAIDTTRAGMFYLAYVLNQSARREYFCLLPSGLYFRSKVFSSVESMLAFWKKNPMPPVPQGHSQQAAPTPGRGGYGVAANGTPRHVGGPYGGHPTPSRMQPPPGPFGGAPYHAQQQGRAPGYPGPPYGAVQQQPRQQPAPYGAAPPPPPQQWRQGGYPSDGAPGGAQGYPPPHAAQQYPGQGGQPGQGGPPPPPPPPVGGGGGGGRWDRGPPPPPPQPV